MINKAKKTKAISKSTAANILRVIVRDKLVLASIESGANSITVAKGDIIETPKDMFTLDEIGEVSGEEVKEVIKAMVMKSELSNDEVTAILSLYPKWKPGQPYTEINELCVYAGILYKVLQVHTSQSDWTPNVAVSLFAKVTPTGVIPVWVQPESTNPFMLGDQVEHNGQVWESTIDNNVWAPGTGQLWIVVV